MDETYEDYIPEDYEDYKVDSYFQEVQKEIKELYERERSSVFYLRQLQIKFEKKYFHWITFNALKGLKELGYLKVIKIRKNDGTSRHYYIHHSNRYPKRKINSIDKIIDEYSQDHITRSCGQRAENLFCLALLKKRFEIIDKNVKKIGKKKWGKTGHNLDFLFRRDKIYYGCEIKNTLGYIDKKELEIKIDMCKYLKIRPLFILRYAPKTYNYKIINNGGFSLIFESQIYEMSQKPLVDKMRKELELPVDNPREIPEGIIERFLKWHKKNR